MNHIRNLVNSRLDHLTMLIDESKGYISELEHRLQREKGYMENLEKEKEELEKEIPPAK